MSDARLVFDIRSFWHAGSGRGAGAAVDATPVVDARGLPYLPGRTVKGLLRDAASMAEACGQLPAGREEHLFGSRMGDGETVANRRDSSPGALMFSDATLPAWVAAHFDGLGPEQRREQADALFDTIKMTAMDGRTGVALDHSLRAMRVAVPVVLSATVSVLGDDAGGALADIERCAPLVRALGAFRNRGLGRVSVRLEGGAR